mmetsp:Transcript_23947/g.43651  ORF Transcript_23947/g.43651 Transcript_23947/m.43651 type:complete len:221 (-) Transcript_23947:1020-1682(-)
MVISKDHSFVVGAIKVNGPKPLDWVASRIGPMMQMAMTPLTACRPTGSVCLAIWRVTSMKKAKLTATTTGSNAGQPTSAKLGCTTSKVPMKPTRQAKRRRAPTSSPRMYLPKSNIMNGMTKAMATASAKGRYCRAVNMAPIPKMCRTVRKRVSQRTRPCMRQARRVAQTSGIRMSACTAKRTNSNCPSGTDCPKSFATASPMGATMQKPSIRKMPRRGLS